jgi:diguanylate cyclase (GGDEF)-like protein/PAS domain S-box-containing protein
MDLDDTTLARALLESMSEALYVVDRRRTITYWNRAAEELTGFPAEEVLGHRCRDGVLNHVDEHGASLCGARCPLVATMRDGVRREVVAYAHHRDGHRLPVAVRAAALHDAEGRTVGAVEAFHDDSRCQSLARRAAEAEDQALVDPLTGVGNRRKLQQALHRLDDEHRRYGRGFAVLFLDVDRFKSVNDTYGHPVGDRALELVGGTRRSCTRPGDVCGRWGGEEFLLLAAVSDEGQARALAERLRRLIASSWLDVEGERLRLTISVGVALSGPDEPVEATVDRADAAMLRAKAEGRNRTRCG